MDATDGKRQRRLPVIAREMKDVAMLAIATIDGKERRPSCKT